MDLLGLLPIPSSFRGSRPLYFVQTSQSIFQGNRHDLLLRAVAAYFASNVLFPMLCLSDQYAAATTDAHRSMLLAAGQVMIAIFNFTAFKESYIITSVALLIISAVMPRGKIFTRATPIREFSRTQLQYGQSRRDLSCL